LGAGKLTTASARPERMNSRTTLKVELDSQRMQKAIARAFRTDTSQAAG
jgi:hypothetical protein